MNIIEAKEKLQKDGYTFFELEEFDKEFYDKLQVLKCNEEKNFKDAFTNLRLDASTFIQNSQENEKIRISENFFSFEKASNKKQEILEFTKKEKEKFWRFSQIWYYTDFKDEYFEKKDIDLKEEYHALVKKMMMYFYDLPEEQEYAKHSSYTYYDKGCHLENHSDGTGTGRICALLIYLNETYDENNGGCLILNNTEKIIPTFGKVAMIDLQSFDIKHLVTEVTGGIGRYALLSFVKKIEQEFIDKGYNPTIK